MEYFKYLVSELIRTQGSEAALLFIIGAVLTSILLKNVFRYFGLYVMVILRNFIIRDLRGSMYSRILVLPLSYFSSERKGDLISRMSSDIADVEVSIMSSLEALFREPMSVIFSVIALVWINPYLTVLVFVTLPVAVGIIALIGRILKRQGAKGQSQMGRLISLFEETLGGVRIIKAFSS
jgi:subfamily B ATP-binding cassette protein MsbA